MYISESFLSLEISLKCSKLDGKLTPVIISLYGLHKQGNVQVCVAIFFFFVCFRWYLFVFDPHYDRFSSRLFRLPIAVLFYWFDD